MKITKQQLERLIKEAVEKEINQESNDDNEHLNEDIGVLTVAAGTALGIIGVYAAAYSIPRAFRLFGSFMKEWAREVNKQKFNKLKAARDAENQANLQEKLESISTKFENDAELKKYLDIIEQNPYSSSVSSKAKKTNAIRSSAMRKLNEHIKSKLDPDELKFVSKISEYLRK